MRIASTCAAGSDPLTNRPIPNIFALQTDTNVHIRLVIISEGALEGWFQIAAWIGNRCSWPGVIHLPSLWMIVYVWYNDTCSTRLYLYILNLKLVCMVIHTC